MAGRLDSLAAFTQQLLAIGAARNAKLLDVAVPSHCDLLTGVATQLQRALAEVPLAEPSLLTAPITPAGCCARLPPSSTTWG